MWVKIGNGELECGELKFFGVCGVMLDTVMW